MNTFFGLDIMRRAIATQRAALDTTGHNVANANTEGYSRQRVIMSATNPYPDPSFNRAIMAGQVGTGVQVEEVTRVREQFLDMQYRNESKGLGFWDAKATTLEKIEQILNEPSDDGLQAVMDQFWEAWQDLSKNPENLSTRAVVRQRAMALTESFNQVVGRIDELESDLNSEVKIKVEQINDYADQIRNLNLQIMRSEVGGDHANDLRDKRDSLVDDLSKLIDVQVSEHDDGMLAINTGNGVLVNGQVATKLEVRDVIDAGGKNLYEVFWATGQSARFNSGALRGVLEARGSIVPTGTSNLFGTDQYEWKSNITPATADAKLSVRNVSRTALVGDYSLNFTGYTPATASTRTAALDVTSALSEAFTGVIEVNGYKVQIEQSDSTYNAVAGTYTLNEAQVLKKINALKNLTGVQVTSGGGGALTFTNLQGGAVDITLNSTLQSGAVPGMTVGAQTLGNNATGFGAFSDPLGNPLTATFAPSDFGGNYLILKDSAGDEVMQLAVNNPATIAAEGTVTLQVSKRDGEIPQVRQRLEVLGLTMAREMNAAHQKNVDMKYLKDAANNNKYFGEAGTVAYATKPFFVDSQDSSKEPQSVLTMAVNPLIQFDLDYIAAGGVGNKDNGSEPLAPGDNKGALNIAELRYRNIAGLPERSTMDDFYRSTISQLGVNAEQASRMKDSQERLSTTIENERQSVSGVSLDEEMANMIQFQQAYNSAARMMTAMDEMLDKLINGTGVVGR